jgi:hypothetical protein
MFRGKLTKLESRAKLGKPSSSGGSGELNEAPTGTVIVLEGSPAPLRVIANKTDSASTEPYDMCRQDAEAFIRLSGSAWIIRSLEAFSCGSYACLAGPILSTSCGMTHPEVAKLSHLFDELVKKVNA